MNATLTSLKRDFKKTLAEVGGLRAQERLFFNEQLTSLISSLTSLENQIPNPAQLNAFKTQLSSFRKDVAHYDDPQQAYYYPSPDSNRNSARR